MVRETPRAAQAWADYLALGPDRSLEKLLESYRSRPSAPTGQVSMLKRWSAAFGWQARLQEIAARQAEEAQEREAARIREIMETGYGRPHERVQLLKRLLDLCVEDVTTRGKRWVQDVKSIGSGEFAERVDLERFNASEFDQIRGLLDDIAKEKGERVKRTEVTGKNGAPLAVALTWAQAVDRLWEQPGGSGDA